MEIHRPPFERTASLSIPLADQTWKALKSAVLEASQNEEIPDNASVQFPSQLATGTPAIRLTWRETRPE